MDWVSRFNVGYGLDAGVNIGLLINDVVVVKVILYIVDV